MKKGWPKIVDWRRLENVPVSLRWPSRYCRKREDKTEEKVLASDVNPSNNELMLNEHIKTEAARMILSLHIRENNFFVKKTQNSYPRWLQPYKALLKAQIERPSNSTVFRD